MVGNYFGDLTPVIAMPSGIDIQYSLLLLLLLLLLQYYNYYNTTTTTTTTSTTHIT